MKSEQSVSRPLWGEMGKNAFSTDVARNVNTAIWCKIWVSVKIPTDRNVGNHVRDMMQPDYIET